MFLHSLHSRNLRHESLISSRDKSSLFVRPQFYSQRLDGPIEATAATVSDSRAPRRTTKGGVQDGKIKREIFHFWMAEDDGTSSQGKRKSDNGNKVVTSTVTRCVRRRPP